MKYYLYIWRLFESGPGIGLLSASFILVLAVLMLIFGLWKLSLWATDGIENVWHQKKNYY